MSRPSTNYRPPSAQRLTLVHKGFFTTPIWGFMAFYKRHKNSTFQNSHLGSAFEIANFPMRVLDDKCDFLMFPWYFFTMHAKLCLKQDGNYDLYYENDIARFASVLKRGGTVFFKLAWKNGSVLFIDATHRMSFSFSRFLVRPASLAEHASIKEKMRKHLRKSFIERRYDSGRMVKQTAMMVWRL